MTNAPADKIDYASLLANLSRTGVYHLPPEGHEAIIAAAESCGHVVFRVDLSHARNKEDLLATIGKDMAFPDWFGYNWDALADSLGDLGWRPAEGYVVLLEHCDRLNAKANSDFIEALEIFAGAADEWRERGVAFWCLVDMHADGIAWLPGL